MYVGKWNGRGWRSGPRIETLMTNKSFGLLIAFPPDAYFLSFTSRSLKKSTIVW
jgi:hypothetical protein